MKNPVFLITLLLFFYGTSFSQIPTAPSNLHIQYGHINGIAMSWNDNSSNESGFVIERKQDGMQWVKIKTVQNNITYFFDTDLVKDVKYYYRIYAYNSYGGSAYSNIVSAYLETTFDCYIGTDTISTPYPFYTTYTDSRTQMLYKKSEMLGYCSVGTIWTITLFSKAQTSTSISNITIKMKSTNDTILTKFIDTGLTVVFNNMQLYVPAYGMILIMLNPQFNWDVNKNLLVEICFHLPSALTRNINIEGSPAQNKVWHRHKPSSNGCTLDSGTIISIRPNLRMNTIIDGVKKISSNTPVNYSIEQNYPNPFNGDTKFKFKIREYSPITLSLYDVLGRQSVVVFSEPLGPGEYEKTFSLTEHPLPSGIYYYCFVANGFVNIKKMVILK